MNEWLNMELETAEEAYDEAVADSGYASPSAKYWAGYANAITNALNELSGMTPNRMDNN